MVTYILSEGKHIFMVQGDLCRMGDNGRAMPSQAIIDWFAGQGVEKISVIPLHTGFAMKVEDENLALAFRMRYC